MEMILFFFASIYFEQNEYHELSIFYFPFLYQFPNITITLQEGSSRVGDLDLIEHS